ncbi:MAG: (2Fe-2S) ferredoxin domain-containing protein, partial [bacterium]|nr:(2Fe-2S) ferredoxin domain-containing protein [bacterium]
LMAVKERPPILPVAAPGSAHVLVGMNTCGIASGARETGAAIRDEISRVGVNASVFQPGCVGMCCDEPLVDVVLPGRPAVRFSPIKVWHAPCRAVTRYSRRC